MTRHIAFRALAVCLVALGALFCLSLFAPNPAFAQHGAGGKKSLAVGLIEGPQGAATRKRVLAKLKQSGTYEITDAEDLRPGADKGAYSAMAQALQVDAIVVGKTSRSLDLTLSVIGPDGNLIEEVKLKGGSGPELEEAIDNELEIALAGPLGSAKKAAGKTDKKAAEETPEDEEEEEVPSDEKEADDEDDEEKPAKKDEDEDEGGGPAVDDKKPGRRPLEFTAGLRIYSRSFVYTDYHAPPPGSSPGRVYQYKLAAAPAVIASARVYPFAFSRDDALGNVGIMGRLEVGIATSTNYKEPQPPDAMGVTPPPITYPLNTGTSEWQVGLRGRLPVGRSELGMFGLYGAHSFVLVGDEGTQGTERRPDPLVPDVNYQFLRFGMDARLRAGKFTVGSHFAPRFLTSMKNIDQDYWWFPGATGSGIDFGAFAAFEILKFMDVAAGVDYIRYGFDFNAIPDDAGTPGNVTSQRIAGGATDTFLSGWVGVTFHFDGKSELEDGAVAVEAEPDADEKKPDPDVEEEEEE
jgi:hypothetical protein